MPLIAGKSKKAFDHNLKTEISVGKPKEQSLAIAYNAQKAARKGYAMGGMVDEAGKSMSREKMLNDHMGIVHKLLETPMDKYALGGEIDEASDGDPTHNSAHMDDDLATFSPEVDEDDIKKKRQKFMNDVMG